MDALFAKAVEAAESGRDALDRGDVNSAVNRAYYAMFNAARAYLATVGQDTHGPHGTIVRLFGMHLVQTGKVSADYGRQFNRAQEARSVADYDTASVSPADAETFVNAAESLVDLMATLLPAGSVDPDFRRRPSQKETQLRGLVTLFAGLVTASGEVLPPGFEEDLVTYASAEDIIDLTARLDEMGDVTSFVRTRIPAFATP